MDKHPIAWFLEALARPAIIDTPSMFDRFKKASDYIGALSRVFFLITLIALLYYKVDPAALPIPWPMLMLQVSKGIVIAFLLIVLTTLLVPLWVYTSVMMAMILLPTREFMIGSGVHMLVWRYVFHAILLLITCAMMAIILGVVQSIDFSKL